MCHQPDPAYIKIIFLYAPIKQISAEAGFLGSSKISLFELTGITSYFNCGFDYQPTVQSFDYTPPTGASRDASQLANRVAEV